MEEENQELDESKKYHSAPQFFHLPTWQVDDDVTVCNDCKWPFTFYRRKHHCRACGLIFCDSCCSSRLSLLEYGYIEPVRVCKKCKRKSLASSLKIRSGKSENATSVDSPTFDPFTHRDSDVKEWLVLIANPKQADLLKLKVFEGIPPSLRATVWTRLSGTYGLLRKNTGVYEALKTKLDEIEFKEELKSDVSRTYPDLLLFSEPDGVGQKALYNVLGCYSLFDNETGYHQGMNFIASILLLQMDEESAFWNFVQIMKGYAIREFFMQSQFLHAWMKEFKKWFNRLLPKLSEHFINETISFEIYVSQWFKTIFSYNFPLEMIFRIWDVFFLEGVDFLVWVGLALFSQSEQTLLGMNQMEIMKFFLQMPETSFETLLNQFKSQM